MTKEGRDEIAYRLALKTYEMVRLAAIHGDPMPEVMDEIKPMAVGWFKDAQKYAVGEPGAARTVVGNVRAQAIEKKARDDAEAGVFEAPSYETKTLWDQYTLSMEQDIYRLQHDRRTERLKRTA